jgi:LPS export ABC transporter protein LptC
LIFEFCESYGKEIIKFFSQMTQLLKKSLYFGLALLWLGCRSQDQQTVTPPNYDGPDQEGWNSRITVTSNGRQTAIVEYAHMEKFSKRRETKFDGGIVVDFYNPEGKHTSNLVSERGVLYEETNDVEALGNVVVVSDSGMTVRTQRLRWDNTRQKIVSNEFVTITTAQNDTLHGKGFQSDQSLKQWSIGKPSGVSQKKIDLTGERADESLTSPDSTALVKEKRKTSGGGERP